jgi:predicted esterase
MDPGEVSRVSTRLRRHLHCALIAAAAVLSCLNALAAEKFSCRTTAGLDNDVEIVSERLAGVPALMRIPKVVTRPPIVLWHGFGPPASEQALMDALPIDDVPAVKVYLGLPLFGARAPSGGVGEVIRRQSEDFASLLFEPAVEGAAKELPGVLKSLQERGCMGANDKIGLFGFSAGGASVLLALALHEVKVSAAVTLNASTGLNASVQALERATKQPYSWTPRSRQLAKSSDAVLHAAEIARGNPPPALLLVHGADDTMLSPQIAVSLHEALRPSYRNGTNEPRLRLVIEPHLAHSWVGTEQADGLRRSIGAWFGRFL